MSKTGEAGYPASPQCLESEALPVLQVIEATRQVVLRIELVVRSAQRQRRFLVELVLAGRAPRRAFQTTVRPAKAARKA
jgi:hypothetical protein